MKKIILYFIALATALTSFATDRVSSLPTHNEIWLALGLFYEWGVKTGTSLEDSAWF